MVNHGILLLLLVFAKTYKNPTYVIKGSDETWRNIFRNDG